MRASDVIPIKYKIINKSKLIFEFVCPICDYNRMFIS